ncbi:lipopolysaccharide heptosyltransferase II [Psychromonas sp. CD1]|uniref:lipopolysaccharide heptosyltransferase II n=1 Tax=Psychromonas sp. CD1 TaxID=1979839 RepID=UPI000B9AE48D|nr:lipopolysaccharide heptosyltransferase II [Psychromonas sp. CD1]
MKILIISPAWVGDMVMSQGLYITLKKLHPNVQIDVVAPAWCKAILDKMPEINNAIKMPLGHGQFDLKTRYLLGKTLRKAHYDIAYILPNSAKSALIPFFAKIPIRTGWKGEMRYGLLTDLRPNKKIFQYMLERYVALAYPKNEMTGTGCMGRINTLPRPHLQIKKEQCDSILHKFKLSLSPTIIGLCPGAEFGPAKRWPERHYASVAKALVKQNLQVWLFGSEKDKNVTNAITKMIPTNKLHLIKNLAGETSLNEAVDLLSCCHTVVSNDSGLMHIAAAVGCNLVAIYGSSSPRYTPPLTENVAILQTGISCQPCFEKECRFSHLECLNKLPPERILNAVQSFLKQCSS